MPVFTTRAQAVQTLQASPEVCALLLTLQAQMAAEIAQALQPAPATPPAGPTTWRVQRFQTIEQLIGRRAGLREEFTRRWHYPESWRGSSSISWHPAHWRYTARRMDEGGEEWTYSGDRVVHVMDDFGYLVPVPAECQ